MVHASQNPTRIDKADEIYYKVNPEDDCSEVFPRPPNFVEVNNADQQWRRVRFTLFSLMISGSVFAKFSPMSFYTGFVLLVGSFIKPAFLYNTWCAFTYEVTHPDAIIKLVESVYMKRHEEDLYMEEENYRCLQEIVRSPELFKALSGSSLAGGCAPILDALSPEDRRKLEHLTMLEKRGFDVEKLKKRLVARQQDEVHHVKDMPSMTIS